MPTLRSCVIRLLWISLLAGCTSVDREMANPKSFPPAIPDTSVLVAFGSGRIAFTAVDPGRMYVYNADTARVVFTTHIEPGQRIVVDPAAGRVLLNGRPVLEQDLGKRKTFRLYYDPRDTAPTTQPQRFDRV